MKKSKKLLELEAQYRIADEEYWRMVSWETRAATPTNLGTIEIGEGESKAVITLEEITQIKDGVNIKRQQLEIEVKELYKKEYNEQKSPNLKLIK